MYLGGYNVAMRKLILLHNPQIKNTLVSSLKYYLIL